MRSNRLILNISIQSNNRNKELKICAKKPANQGLALHHLSLFEKPPNKFKLRLLLSTKRWVKETEAGRSKWLVNQLSLLLSLRKGEPHPASHSNSPTLPTNHLKINRWSLLKALRPWLAYPSPTLRTKGASMLTVESLLGLKKNYWNLIALVLLLTVGLDLGLQFFMSKNNQASGLKSGQEKLKKKLSSTIRN
jgi:hypothetical protein